MEDPDVVDISSTVMKHKRKKECLVVLSGSNSFCVN